MLDEVPPCDLIDHAADLGIILRAPDLNALFERAEIAMFDLLTDIARVAPRDELRIAVSGQDLEDLLVAWLGELLCRFDGEEWLFRYFRIDILTGTRLEASVWGELYNDASHVVTGEQKAVTHHDTWVWHEAAGWNPRVIFDL